MKVNLTNEADRTGVVALRAQLATDGFVVVPQLLNKVGVAKLSRLCDMLLAGNRTKSRQVLYADGLVPEGTPALDRLLHQWLNPHRFDGPDGTGELLPTLFAAASALLDTDPVLFQDLILIKDATQAAFPMHQDFPFWPIDRPQGVVCWISLVPNTKAAGGLMFARGSHRLGIQSIVDLHRDRPQDPAHRRADLSDFEFVTPALLPGDAVFFSPLVYHGSPRRRDPGLRAAWSSIWMHPECRWSHARVPAHPLCRETRDGESVRSVYVDLRPPDPAASD